MNHLFHAMDESGHGASLRYVQTLIKMWQNLDVRRPAGAPEPPPHVPFATDPGPVPDGWWLTHVTPWRLLAAGGSFWVDVAPRREVWEALDRIEPGLGATVRDALLEAWLDKTETYPVGAWPRGDTQNEVNRVGYVPTPFEGTGALLADSTTTADGIYRAVPRLRAAGADPALVERLRAWGARMWPAGDWEALRR